MAAEDFMESEVALAAAATAAILSPRAREVARQGAVYGVAGVLTAGRAVAGMMRGAVDGVGAMMPTDRGSRGSRGTSGTRGAAAANSGNSARSRAAGSAARTRAAAPRAKPRTKTAGRSTGGRGSGNAGSSAAGSTSAASSA